jgi:hypothetical protein
MILHNVAANSAFIMIISFQIREAIQWISSTTPENTQILCLILAPRKANCRRRQNATKENARLSHDRHRSPSRSLKLS